MIYYIRDDEGRLVGFKYNNTKYYYIKNLQDDIIGIMDSSFNTIVSYKYDNTSWNMKYSPGMGGEFTSDGNILTFWYKYRK